MAGSAEIPLPIAQLFDSYFEFPMTNPPPRVPRDDDPNPFRLEEIGYSFVAEIDCPLHLQWATPLQLAEWLSEKYRVPLDYVIPMAQQMKDEQIFIVTKQQEEDLLREAVSVGTSGADGEPKRAKAERESPGSDESTARRMGAGANWPQGEGPSQQNS